MYKIEEINSCREIYVNSHRVLRLKEIKYSNGKVKYIIQQRHLWFIWKKCFYYHCFGTTDGWVCYKEPDVVEFDEKLDAVRFLVKYDKYRVKKVNIKIIA